MTKGLFKRFSYGMAFAFVVLLILLAAGAMFFTDDFKEEFLSPEYKSTQVMEIRGNWLGMRMVSLDSPAARHSGVPPSARGVMVVELEDRIGWRARQAGVQEGDVIMAVNGKEIRDLADLYDLSQKLDAGPAIFLNILRWGQPMTLVLPAVYTTPSVAGLPQGEQEFQTAPMTAQRGNAGAAQLAALVVPARGPMFHCPIHNRVWPQNEVHPHYRCPLCYNQLNRVR